MRQREAELAELPAELSATTSHYHELILDTVEQAVIVTSRDGTIISWNRFAEKLYGWNKDEAIGRSIGLLVPIAEQPAAQEIMARLNEGRSWTGEFLVRHKHGDCFTVEIKNVPVLGDDGQVRAIVGVSSDVSERRRAELALRQSEQRFRAFMEQAPFSVQLLSPNGTTLRVNRAWEQLWGATLADLADYNMLEDPQLAELGILDYIRQGFLGKSTEIPAACYDATKTLPTLARFPDSARWVTAVIYPLKDAEGRVSEVALVHRDITDHKRAEDALRSREQQLRQLADNLPAGFIYQIHVAPDGQRRFSYVSRGVESICEVSVDQVLADPDALHRQIHPDDAPRTAAQEAVCLATGKPFDCQFRVCAAHGTRWLHCRSALSHHHDGSQTWDGIAIDITEPMKLERQLRDADRRKDEFLAMLAHELRNPLAAAVNALGVARLAGIDQATQAWSQEVLDRQLHQLRRLIDDLMDVSRITRGKIQLKRQRVEVAAVVHAAVEVARPLIEEAGHRLSLVTLGAQQLWVNGDPARLEQVLVNLLTNAAKYTPHGGEICVTTLREDNQAVVRVRDNGMGLPTEVLPRVFDLFAQADRALDRSQGGLGIGLTLVKRLVELHGGTVVARSEGEGRGSEFEARLPLTSEPTRALAAPPSPAAPTTGKRVLVVDDNADVAKTLSLILRAHGHHAEIALAGRAALELAATFKPEIAILDIGLPEMNGYELARRLRQIEGLADILLVALSGYGQPDDRRRSREAGFDCHLVKPVNQEELRVTLAKSRGESRPA